MTTAHAFLLSVLFIYLCKPGNATQFFQVRDVCQGTSNGLTTVNDTPENRIANLRNRYKDCEYVDGNLEITGLDHPLFYNKDLSFLNGIREVTGYVLIANVYVQNVTLENLTIIRGDSLYYPPGISRANKSTAGISSSTPSSPSSTTTSITSETRGYALFVSLNFMSSSDAIGMRLLGLRNLTEVSTGDVLFENNNLLCYATTDIFWPDILADGDKQNVKFNNDIVADVKPCKPGCHDSCLADIPEARAKYCWGPGKKNCQKMNKVTCAEQCDGGRCFGLDSTKCCHAECAGGCDGPSKTDCWGCKNFYNDGGCEPYCPRQMLYDNSNFRWVVNPDRKYAYGKLCTEKCPRRFLEHDGGCVRSCPAGFESKDEVKCQACAGPCAKRCRLSWQTELDYLNAENIDELVGCTSVDGHLKILDYTFRGDKTYGIPAMPVEKLSILKSIKEITEYLLVQGVEVANLTTLDFLSNLERILGRVGDRFDAALNVMGNVHLRYLGLTSLRAIASGHVIIQDNPNLCYLNSFKWEKIRKGEVVHLKNVVKNADELNYCGPNGFVCDDECKHGCWGPNNTRCVACLHSRYKDHCLIDCTRDLLFNVQGERECKDCHPQCKSDCNGPSAKDCDECKNYRDGPYCVEECPNDHVKDIFKYPDSNNTCQLCHSNCIKGCTGPGNFVGVGGCSSCEVSVASDDETTIIECLPRDAACHPGYFPNTHARGDLSFLKDFTVCTRCDPLCAECDEKGNYLCSKCTHYRSADMCVEKCDSDHYADEESKMCHRCHHTCRRDCTGPTEWQCHQCAHYKVYSNNEQDPSPPDIETHSLRNINLQTTTSSASSNVSSYSSHQTTESQQPLEPFYCTKTKECPSHKPDSFQEEMDTVCTVVSTATDSKGGGEVGLPLVVIIGIAIGAAVFLILTIGALIWCYWRKAGDKDRKWTQITAITTGLEPVDPSSAPPDMSKLRLIKEIELRRGGILGSGAFGTVYKGVWLPEGENLKIPVAIKVLQEGNSSHQNQELLEEARVMASVEHPCCVRIVAVCMTEQMMLITQLMPLGSLLDYVKNNKNRISSKVMLNWCTQIAKGMMYLESKGVVHRDLAARNVLVRNPNQVKITDFGLAKLLDCNEGAYHSVGGKMPIKWLALESIQHRKFTHKTDVWSYGVTLWEIFTYGQKPYENNRAYEVPELLDKGERLPQPSICTIDVYMFMIKCWVIGADSRPSFSDLADEFAKMSRDPGRYLVIKGDSHMRLPSSSMDAREMVMNQSSELLSEEGPEQIMDADDYLHTYSQHSLSSATTDVTYANIDMAATARTASATALPSRFSNDHRNGSLPTRHRDNHNNQSSGALHMTYPRHHGSDATYINGFLSRESTPGMSSSCQGSSSTLDRGRANSQCSSTSSALRAGSSGAIHSTSVNSLKPFRTSDSLLCIEEISQDNLKPPDYFEMSSNNRPTNSSTNQRGAKHDQLQQLPVYEDDYLKPRSQSASASGPPDHHAPPTPAKPDATEKPNVFSFNPIDNGDKQQQQQQRIFANPEYYDGDNMTAPAGPRSDEHYIDVYAEGDPCNPLLPPLSNPDYYNSIAAFGSDSSARDSFVST